MGQLEEGIAAAKSGDVQLARTLLTNVLEEDETNERAWLWLSGVVDTLEDRQECLENVLAINPSNQLALRGMARLERERLSLAEPEPDGPLPLAAAQTSDAYQAPSYEPLTITEPTAQVSPEPFVEDVWTMDVDLCAYCATPLEEDAKRCQTCRRRTVKKEFRYPATAILHIFWVVLVALSIVLLFQAIYKWQVEENEMIAVLHAVPAGALLLLAVGIFFRLAAAHVVSVFVLLLVLGLSVANFFTPFDPTTVDAGSSDVAVFGVAITMVERTGLFLEVAQGVIVAIALFYALFRAAPEFDRVSKRIVARVVRGLNTAADYHLVARRFVQDGMWASAVLHWQRAVAIEPSSIVFQRSLAKSYIQLGQYDLALNVLETAQHLQMQPATRVDIEKLLGWVSERVGLSAIGAPNQKDGE